MIQNCKINNKRKYLGKHTAQKRVYSTFLQLHAFYNGTLLLYCTTMTTMYCWNLKHISLLCFLIYCYKSTKFCILYYFLAIFNGIFTRHRGLTYSTVNTYPLFPIPFPLSVSSVHVHVLIVNNLYVYEVVAR